jgi:arylsulfatase A-like enzyme
VWARCLALAATVAPLVACDPGGAAQGPRSIFLIVVDTLRADALSCYDASAKPTPHIDALAGAGVRFEAARATASWTLPSMASLLTSQLPRELEMLERRDDSKWPKRWRQQRRVRRMSLSPDATTLAEVLHDAGYLTAAFVDQPLLAPRRDFDRGFDRWVQAVGEGGIQRRGQSAPGNRQTWGDAVHAQANDALLVDAFGEWLREAPSQRPVFAWIHLLTPHRPYLSRGGVAPAKQERNSRDLYDGEVRAVDALTGRIVEMIRARAEPRHARPVVAFTSDHGEAFGEHGVFEHGNTLHGEVLRVPLILAAEGALPEGEVVHAVASLVDVGPTLLELAGLSVPPSMIGESLLSLLSDRGRSRPVLAEGMLYGPGEQAWIEGRWKLMIDRSREAPALYDLGDDPGELHDLYESEPARAQALRLRLAATIDELSANPRPAPEDAADAETRDALRALGYVDDGSD